jgi:acyl-coenzyme A thioesterase PaaI-like protein
VQRRPGPHDARPEPGTRLDGRQRRDRQPERPRQRSYRWEDPARSGAAARTLAGADFFGAIADGTLPPPPIASTLGFTLVSVVPGRAVFEFTPSEFHYNPIGSVHGGVCATMCDSACGCAVHSMLPAVTTSTGPLRCEGTVIHLGSRTALAQASLTDATGRQYAHATSSCLIFRP